eukprot:Phypoly_transcript_23611.p1 GENE.Phypoly_transcript_23611~~Phypoly_transcript_23611.p1  ORF type:complete len:160 (+),score=28.23 Phypoly_transcript_23611:62-481(+)
MKSLILLAFVLMISAAFGQEWTNCGTSSDKFQLSTVTITPNPIVKGQNVTISVTGTMEETVTSGTASVKVEYGIITVFNKDESICDPPVLPCPIPQGPWTKVYTVLLPGDAPGGTYKAQSTVVDQNNAQLLCVNADLKI